MKGFHIIFLLILLVPFIEIYLLLKMGGFIGAFPTIMLVVFTAALGTWLVRQQGFATFQKLQANLAQGTIPAYEMIEGPIILVGGILLLTPGFITDMLGLVCLIPQFRRKIAQYVIENHMVQSGGQFQWGKPKEKDVLEGEYRKED